MTTEDKDVSDAGTYEMPTQRIETLKNVQSTGVYGTA